MKKTMPFLLLIAFLPGLASCGEKIDAPKHETYTGTQNVEGTEYDISFNYDEEMLLSFDTTEYNKDVGILTSIMSVDLYDSDSTGLNGYDGESIYEALGFDYEKITMDKKDYEFDEEDITTYVLAKKKIKYENEIHTLLFVIFQGSNKNADFWKSNLDIGADTKSYYQMTGEHPEWKDTSCHKGFYIAAARAEAQIDDFIGNDTKNLTMIITGHSRGGGIANLCGMYYETKNRFRSTAYTFASPETVENPTVSCKTIFNVINEDDLIPSMPPSCWGMTRYGTDVTLNMKSYNEEYESLFRSTYDTCNPAGITTALLDLAPTRESLYSFIEDDKGESYYDYYIIKSNESSGMEHLKVCLKREGLLGYTEVYIKEGTIDYLCLRLSPAFLINFAVNVAFDESPLLYLANRATYLSADYYRYALDLYDEISTDGIYDAHIESTYYLLSTLL